MLNQSMPLQRMIGNNNTPTPLKKRLPHPPKNKASSDTPI